MKYPNLEQYPTYTISDVLNNLPSPLIASLHAPQYEPSSIPSKDQVRIGLAVESMKDHTTDEGWQIFNGLSQEGYTLCGYNLPVNLTHVPDILSQLNPSVIVVQDKREWDTKPGDFREPKAKFTGIECLASRPDIFKITILKDAQQRPLYHRASAEEIACHAWIIYYNPQIVKQIAPYLRSHHLIRTYHSVDSSLVPPYEAEKRVGCLLSGAISGAYPLRTRLVSYAKELPHTIYLPHPGYHKKGTATPHFLETLSRFKVAICTASMYGYSLRKMIEATACGCRVITDLPVDEFLPAIDENMYRVHPSISISDMGDVIKFLIETYDPVIQQKHAEMAKLFYDYKRIANRLAINIEAHRTQYRS